MDGSLSTGGKLRAIMTAQPTLNGIRFRALCGLYGIDVSNSAVTRAQQSGSFSNDSDKKVRPIVLRLEDLISRMRPVKISFDDVEHIKLLLDLICDGLDLRVGEPLSIFKKDSEERQ